MYQALPAIHIRIPGEPGNEAKRNRYACWCCQKLETGQQPEAY